MFPCFWPTHTLSFQQHFLLPFSVAQQQGYHDPLPSFSLVSTGIIPSTNIGRAPTICRHHSGYIRFSPGKTKSLPRAYILIKGRTKSSFYKGKRVKGSKGRGPRCLRHHWLLTLHFFQNGRLLWVEVLVLFLPYLQAWFRS